jgi:hypothetical protein
LARLLARATAEARSVFIFQLPAMSFLRMKIESYEICGGMPPRPKGLGYIAQPSRLGRQSTTFLPHRLHLRIGAEQFEVRRHAADEFTVVLLSLP